MNTLLEIQAEQFVKRFRSTNTEATASIVGPYGYGKTSMLAAVAEKLKVAGFAPILLSPPTEELDTGCAALVQLTSGLKDAGLLNGQADDIKNPAIKWTEKLRHAKNWIASERERVVLLCDEPYRWPIAKAAEAKHSSYSNEHTKQFVEWLEHDCVCRRIVSRIKIAGQRDTIKPHFLYSYLDGVWEDHVKNAPSDVLADLAVELLGRLQPPPDQIGTLYFQLLIAYAFLISPTQAATLVRQNSHFGQVVERILEALRKPENRTLLEVLDVLSLTRGLISHDLLNRIADNKLEPGKRYLLKSCLLSRVGTSYMLPDALKLALLSRVREKTQDVTRHQELRALYSEAAIEAQSASVSSIGYEYEAWFHGSSLGDESIITSAFFVDQLHLLGRTLSRDFRMYDAASRVFHKSIELDPDDDYGSHYYAYNLDCLAEQRAEIESAYKKALELNETHPWWWSRWINYLITTGSMREAKAAWVQASENLGTAAGKADEWVYLALHVWVARLSLHRAQLDFVAHILQDVPPALLQNDSRFRALHHHLVAMRIARDAEAVFPIDVAPESYWTKPNLDLPLTSKEGTRVNWYPARIDYIDEEYVGMVVGKHDAKTNLTTYGSVEMTHTLFDNASMDEKSDRLEEGRFIEIGFYGPQEAMIIRVHPNEDYLDPYLPDFDPPNPRRYLEKSD